MEAPWLTPPKEFKRVHSAGKVMASIFWDSQEAIMIDYLEQGRTINGAYYAGELRRLRQEIARKRRGILTPGVLLMQDNTPPPLPTRHKLPWLLRLNVDSKSFLILHILLIWLLLTSICSQTEIASSWYTIWKQWRRARGIKRVLRPSIFERIRKLEQRWAKCIALREIISKGNDQISIPW